MSLSTNVFAITGTLSRPRQEIVAMIEAKGGTVAASVTKKVTHLIVSDPKIETSKTTAAKKNGTVIISEEDLVALAAGPMETKPKAVPSKKEPEAKPKAVAAKKEPEEPEEPEAKPKAVAAKAVAAKLKQTVIAKPTKDLPLAGMTIAISGKLSRSKEELADIITANGGTYANTVTKKITHVIARESDAASAKLQKARKHGAEIVAESFLDGMTGKSKDGDDPTKEKSATEAPPGVLLAQKYNPDKFSDKGPIGWWVSEKLGNAITKCIFFNSHTIDGVRCYWDGKQLLSRVGNKFHAPDWFIEQLPKDHHLDGELFIGRGQFKATVSVVKSHEAGLRWKNLTFMIFDIPSAKTLEYEQRMELLTKVCVTTDGQPIPNVKIVEQTLFTGEIPLDKMLRDIELLKGEGLMLRQPKSKYETKRSHTLLKVKSFFDDEAKVIGYATEGTGRLTGMTGSLSCVNRKGVTFDCGSGLDDELRRNPPPIGTIITYRYQELSADSGRPRFPTFVGIAIDKEFP
jgi:DNA ligase-1